LKFNQSAAEFLKIVKIFGAFTAFAACLNHLNLPYIKTKLCSDLHLAYSPA